MQYPFTTWIVGAWPCLILPDGREVYVQKITEENFSDENPNHVEWLEKIGAKIGNLVVSDSENGSAFSSNPHVAANVENVVIYMIYAYNIPMEAEYILKETIEKLLKL
jgi:hypothetical protein